MNRDTYDAYGNRTSSSETVANPFGYAGGYRAGLPAGALLRPQHPAVPGSDCRLNDRSDAGASTILRNPHLRACEQGAAQLLLHDIPRRWEEADGQWLAARGGWGERKDRKPGKPLPWRGLRSTWDYLEMRAEWEEYRAKPGRISPAAIVLPGGDGAGPLCLDLRPTY